MFIPLLLTFIVLLVIFVRMKMIEKYKYWKERGVIYEEPSFLFGNYGKYGLQREYIGYTVEKLCEKYPNEPFIGAYFGTEPVIIVKDLDLVKTVMAKDFNHFNSRDIMDYIHREILGKCVLFSNGENWKLARNVLSPMFSASKMKLMFPLFENCAYNFEKFVDSKREFEMRDLMSEFTMDTIISCSFGVELNKNNGFRRIGHLFFNHNFATFSIIIVRFMWPGLFYKLGLSVFPGVIYRFFKKLLKAVFEARGYKPSARNDFVDLLLKTRETNSMVDDDFMVAQSAALFLAGYETTANAMAFAVYELAKNPDIQEKVLKEVDGYLAKHGNRLDYDCTTELPYLDACVHEALRLYPVLGVITREVSEEYVMPSGLTLERGMRVHIPAYYFHRCDKYFAEPNRFMPERFLPENKDSVLPYSYLPFGGGHRSCSGNRFAKMQAITGLITLFKKYKVVYNKRTPKEVCISPRSISSLAVGGLWMSLETREGWETRVYAKN